LKRKRELFAKGVKFKKLSKKTYLQKPRNKVYFINSEHRPVIKIMGGLMRAVYLKKIINRAVPGYKNRIKGVNSFFSNPLQCARLLGKQHSNKNSRPHVNFKKMPGQNNKLLKNLILKKRARH
jgi:hypothetical protein